MYIHDCLSWQDRAREPCLDAPESGLVAPCEGIYDVSTRDAVRTQPMQNGPVKTSQSGEIGVHVQRIRVPGQAI